MKIVLTLIATLFMTLPACAQDTIWTHVDSFLKAPESQMTIGDGHGDIAVDANGKVYVSVQGGVKPGVQIYRKNGRYIGNLQGAATDFHGFRIHQDQDGIEYLYGTELEGQRLVKWTLDGKLVLAVDVAEKLPAELMKERKGKLGVRLTGLAVTSDDRIFVTDGYATSRIHEFDQQGNFVRSIAGKSAPWNFTTAHKIIVDTRFSPERLLVTDREAGRIVWLDFEGKILGARTGLRRPSAMAIQGDLLAIAELHGRTTVLDNQGEVVASLGTNDNAFQISTPGVPPQDWQNGLHTSPHGVAFDKDGNILVTEWNKWGRVLFYQKNQIGK